MTKFLPICKAGFKPALLYISEEIMKEIVSINFGESRNDYEIEAEFLGKKFNIKRIGVDGDIEKAAELVRYWDGKADIIGLGHIKFAYTVGPEELRQRHAKKIQMLRSRIQTPVVTGDALRKVGHEWAVRHVQQQFGGNYFNNARIFFFSGLASYTMATVLSEYSDNFTFADSILENGIPIFLRSLKEVNDYAQGLHKMLGRIRSKRLPLQTLNDYLIRKAMQKAHIIVIPYYGFWDYVKHCSMKELSRKIVFTSTAYTDRIEFLKERGVEVVIDSTPKILERVVGVNVLESLIIAALEKHPEKIATDDLLDVITELKMDPRVVFPFGKYKRVNRFAFVIHPLSQEYLKKDKSIELISKIMPSSFMNVVEKAVAYSPPWVYSKVTGIISPTGAEAEGWLITVGGTPRQMLSRSPEFTYNRLLEAAKMAKRMGAQIMGLGAFTKVVGDAGVTVAKLANIPITTGNSYSASGALWAAADAARRMGLIKTEHGKFIGVKAMVIGATGAIGSVCARLLALACEELFLVDVRESRLLGLRQSILQEQPNIIVKVSTQPDRYLPDMDVIVTATSAAGKKVLDIMKVKPGCVITDVARPLDLSAEDVAKRPDVLVIESGEIELPGYPEMKNIGLPAKVAYACLAETIVLALEGRFENFTIGRNIEWEKVKEIYKLGIKHGMKLAAISGVNGVFGDEDIVNVRQLALEARRSEK